MFYKLSRTLAVTALLATALPSRGCIWDRDTLGDEVKGLPGIVDVLSGRFERNPPLYYEMRLKRVTAELANDPENLGLYDDAAVACDRLGQGTAAISWMEKKKAQLEKRSDTFTIRDHKYKYFANQGTFKAHEWFRQGAKRDNPQLMQEGILLIKKALELNPDAHFGREKYQLKFMEWVLEPTHEIQNSNGMDYLPDFQGLSPDSNDRSTSQPAWPNSELKKISTGIQGLIVLGNAWESLDSYNALIHVHGLLMDSSIQDLAMARTNELIAEGKKSVVFPEHTGKTLIELIRAGRTVFNRSKMEEQVPSARLLKNGEQWHKLRTEFMLSRLKAGKHPDTDKDFWNGYSEVEPIKLELSPASEKSKVYLSWTSLKDLPHSFELALLLLLMIIASVVYRLPLSRFIKQKKNGSNND